FLRREEPKQFEQLVESASSDTLIRYVLSNVETSLTATDEDVIALYASLVEDQQIRNDILDDILDELLLTRNMVSIAFKQPIESRRKAHFSSNRLRSEALYPLHLKQVQLLQQWRQIAQKNSEEAEGLLFQLRLTINAIAGALRATG
ncbi:phosphoenolpyruvate carboxylase, partial [bacterium]|nr:phosphoenolpyruvate carboxylase [bacterium]